MLRDRIIHSDKLSLLQGMLVADTPVLTALHHFRVIVNGLMVAIGEYAVVTPECRYDQPLQLFLYQPIDTRSRMAVSYTHLTLPTKRIV